MPVDWPLTLPQAPGTFSEQRTPIVVSTDPDTGPSKTRRRFTKSKRTASMTFLLTIEQYLTLDDFFYLTLQGGATSMYFVHPWRQQVVEMYVKEPPSASNQEGLGVSVSMRVEYF